MSTIVFNQIQWKYVSKSNISTLDLHKVSWASKIIKAIGKLHIEQASDKNEQTLSEEEVESIFSAISKDIPEEGFRTKLSFFKN